MNFHFRRFDHTLVGDITKGVLSNEEGETTYKYGEGYVLGGVKVRRNLYDFAMHLKTERGFRDVEFGINPALSHPDEVYVYHPDHVYTLGRIGYRDYNIGDNSDIRMAYCVTAPRVMNNKYRRHERAKYWALSTHFDRAMNNARKLLRPYSTEEIAYLSAGYAKHGWDGERVEKMAERRDALDNLFGATSLPDSKVFKELRHLYEEGYVFQSKEVNKLLPEAIAQVDAEHAFANTAQRVSMVFTTSSGRSDETLYNVVHGPTEGVRGDIDSISAMAKAFENGDWVSTHCQIYTEATMPDELRLSLAVLGMVDDKTYVPNTGYRVTGNLMYVFY